jgi:hypothetical protein
MDDRVIHCGFIAPTDELIAYSRPQSGAHREQMLALRNACYSSYKSLLGNFPQQHTWQDITWPKMSHKERFELCFS